MTYRIAALALAAAGAIHLASSTPASAQLTTNGGTINGLTHNGLTHNSINHNGLHPNGVGLHDTSSDAEPRSNVPVAFDFSAVEAVEIELPEVASAQLTNNGGSFHGVTHNGLGSNGTGPRDVEHRFDAVAAFDFNTVEALEIELPEADEPVNVAKIWHPTDF